MMKPIQAIVFNQQEREQFETLKSLLDSSTYRHEKLAVLADVSGISLTKLKVGFKQFYGVSIYHYFLQRRMERAKQLLSASDLPVKVIALECGFRNCQHFITTFKKWVGVTPGGYRAKLI